MFSLLDRDYAVKAKQKTYLGQSKNNKKENNEKSFFI